MKEFIIACDVSNEIFDKNKSEDEAITVSPQCSRVFHE
jgi:hypothetical protein